MANAVTNLSPAQSLIANALDTPNKAPVVYGADFGYNVIQQITNLVNKGKSKKTDNAKIEVAKMGSTQVIAQIASNSASGSLLVVTFAQPNENFRLDWVVMDSNKVQGRIVAKTATTITLQKVNGTAWNTSTEFIAGQYVKSLFNVSKNFNSSGTEDINYIPEYDYSFTSVTRESGYLSRRDKIGSYPMWKNGYWYTGKEELARKNFSRQIEHKYMYSERSEMNAGSASAAHTTGGIRWSIKNNGGNYYPLSNALTTSTWHDILADYSTKTANGGRKVMALMGTDAMFNIQANMTSDFVKFGGTSNTFGGSVKGLAVKQYAIGNIEIDFVHYPLFDDENLFPEISSITGKRKESHTICLLDMSPTEAADGSGMIAPIERYYFGEDGDFTYKVVPGMIGSKGEQASNDKDGMSFELMTDDGIFVHPEKMGWIELTA